MITRRNILRLLSAGLISTPAIPKIAHVPNLEIYKGFELRWRDYAPHPVTDGLVGIWFAKRIKSSDSCTLDWPHVCADGPDYLAAPTTGGCFGYMPEQFVYEVWVTELKNARLAEQRQPPIATITSFSTTDERDIAKQAAHQHLIDYIDTCAG